jgi:hypothetical protein
MKCGRISNLCVSTCCNDLCKVRPSRPEGDEARPRSDVPFLPTDRHAMRLQLNFFVLLTFYCVAVECHIAPSFCCFSLL